MQVQRLILALCLPAILFIASCGGSIKQPAAPNPFENLNGNWRITGQSSLLPGALKSPNPYLGAAIGVFENHVYANVETSAPCSQGNGGIGGTGPVSGQIASDGSFLLSNSATPISSVQFSIKGNAPSSGNAWQGSYAVFNSTSETSCTFNQSGAFTATPYPAFDGDYAGAISGQGLGSGISVAMKVSQGAPALAFIGPQKLPSFSIPLSGTITVSGSSCFASGEIPNNLSGGVSGDSFHLDFLMNDGSSIHLNGWFADQTEATLRPVSFIVVGGQCNGASGSGTLTLQP